MCGIWGVVTKKASLTTSEVDKLLPQLLIAGNLRGTDGAGIFSIHKDFRTQITKREQNSFHLLFDKEFIPHQKEIWKDGIAYFGHNRAATKGERNKENAHPFETEHLILMHNGTVTNGLDDYNKNHEVDSACLAHMIEEIGMLETSKRVSMAYALIWYDKRDKTLHFCRNNDRPLFILETENAYFFVSEKEMMTWILTRNNEKVIKSAQIPPLLEFVINLETDTSTTVKLETKSYYPSTNYYGSNNIATNVTPITPSQVGKEIEFTIQEWEKPKPQSDGLFQYHGRTVLGFEIKFATKRDFSQELRSVFYKGVVASVEKIGYKYILILKAKTVKKINPLNTNKLPDKYDDSDVLELGDGTLITAQDYLKNSQGGCGMCGIYLHIEDHQQQGETPCKERILCADCTAEYIIDTQKFKIKYDYKRHVH